MKSKSLNKMYKSFTESVVKEAFGWNDKFLRENQNKIEQNHVKSSKKSLPRERI